MTNSRILTRTLLLFWAAWFSVVSSSNAADALREADLLPASWLLVSGNLALIAESISVYSLSRAWAIALFGLVLVAQLTTSVLFWRAALQADPLTSRARPIVLFPFLVGIGSFCGFLVFDELLLVYRRFPTLETAHFAVLGALLLSLALIHLLDGEGAA